MSRYKTLQNDLIASPKRWLVTGGAGFIGSNLLEVLLQYGQEAVCLDNFSTGTRAALEEVERQVGATLWSRCRLIEGDITNPMTCGDACTGVDYVLHQAALGSVPRSIADPVASNRANIDGFLNMLVAARDAKVKRFIYASSGAVYGDHPGLPKIEGAVGRPLSPYAVTKCVNELYADVFAKTYGMKCIGLRYFNVFGRRQRPDGPYAAVIPKWVSSLLLGMPCLINGDGTTSRDFCYVDNVIQANLLAATTQNQEALNTVYNIAVGRSTSLLQLYTMIKERLVPFKEELQDAEANFGPFRPGDVQHSLADITKAGKWLAYVPTHTVEQGLDAAIPWYVETLGRRAG